MRLEMDWAEGGEVDGNSGDTQLMYSSIVTRSAIQCTVSRIDYLTQITSLIL